MPVIEAQYLDHWGLTITSISNRSAHPRRPVIMNIHAALAPSGTHRWTSWISRHALEYPPFGAVGDCSAMIGLGEHMRWFWRIGPDICESWGGR